MGSGGGEGRVATETGAAGRVKGGEIPGAVRTCVGVGVGGAVLERWRTDIANVSF